MDFSDKNFLLCMLLLIWIPLIDSDVTKNHSNEDYMDYDANEYDMYEDDTMDDSYEEYSNEDNMNDDSYDDDSNTDDITDGSYEDHSNAVDRKDESHATRTFEDYTMESSYKADSYTADLKHGNYVSGSNAGDNPYNLDSILDNAGILNNLTDILTYNSSDINHDLSDADNMLDDSMDDATTYKPIIDFIGENTMKSDPDFKMEGFIHCLCGSTMLQINKILDVVTAKRIFTEVADSISVNQNFSLYPTFIDTKDCHMCEVGYYSCKQPYTDCIQRAMEFEIFSNHGNENSTIKYSIISLRSTPFFSESFDVPIGGLGNITRRKREIDHSHVDRLLEDMLLGNKKIDVKLLENMFLEDKYRKDNRIKNLLRIDELENSTCSYPGSMKTAALSCTTYRPFFIRCFQLCAYGYTSELGIKPRLQCKFRENKWTPTGFKECQPFVDCTAKLIAGGIINCTRIGSTAYDRPECRIECDPYEDEPYLPPTSFFCDANGEWDPPLPKCAVPTSLGFQLVEPPKIKFPSVE